MSVSRFCVCLLVGLLAGREGLPQTAKRSCGVAGTIKISVEDETFSSTVLTYGLGNPAAFVTSTVEVWDRPGLLFRKRVPVQATGQVVWAPKREPADTPLALWIQVDDPQFHRDVSDPSAMVGTAGPVEGGPVPELIAQSTVIEEGTQSPTVLLKGKNFGENNTRIMLLEQEGPQVWIVRDYLPSILTDLQHISVQIPSGYLLKPTVLRLEAVRPGDESGYQVGMRAGGGFHHATVHVMSRDRPVLSGVDPSQVSALGGQGGVPIRILGSGFTNESQVLISEQGGIDFSSASKPVFISANELQVTVRDDQLRTASSVPDADFQLWVQNGDGQHVSDPQTLTLVPNSEYPLAGARRPSIVSVSPYPVPLMDQRTSGDLLLKIYGENFEDGDIVVANDGELHARDGTLRTEFISSQQLNAWLPHELWRSHRLSFRLNAQTSSGMCSVEVWQEQ
jgi:hypothetical protein